MTLWIRPAAPLDAGQMGAILQGFLDATPWIPNLHSAAETIGFCGTMIDRGWVRVAGHGARVDAFLARDGAEICALYVAEPARGIGLGRALLDDAKATTPGSSCGVFRPMWARGGSMNARALPKSGAPTGQAMTKACPISSMPGRERTCDDQWSRSDRP